MRRFTIDGHPVWIVLVLATGELDVFSTRKRAQVFADTLIRQGYQPLLVRLIVRKD